MLFKSLLSATLLASVFAQPVQHQHHQHEKRVTHTVVVTVGADGVAATTAATSTAAAAVADSSVTTSTSVASEVSIGSSTGSTAASAASGTFSGAATGITYSPYADDGTCKSASDVKTEIEALSDYSVIRLYGVDCDQVTNVLAAMSSEQKLFAGIYDMTAIADGVSTLASAVEAANGWDQVLTVSIGNELVNSGEATASQIKSYVEEGRTALTAAGYTGKVVSVDTFIAVINNPDLCDYSDYMAVNAHAYFDGGVAAADAGTWVLEQIERVSSACDGADVLIVESGWPTKGDTYGDAIPGTSEQAAALADISDKCGSDVFFFNAYNDMWKDPGTYGVEQYWGIYSS